MKKLIITCALLTSVSFVSFAQSSEVKMKPAATAQVDPSADPTPRQLTEKQLNATAKTANVNTKELEAKLGLTKEQYVAVYKIEYRYQSQYDKYPANGVAVPGGLLSNITSERNIKLKEILTPEQFTKYQGMNK